MKNKAVSEPNRDVVGTIVYARTELLIQTDPDRQIGANRFQAQKPDLESASLRSSFSVILTTGSPPRGIMKG